MNATRQQFVAWLKSGGWQRVDTFTKESSIKRDPFSLFIKMRQICGFAICLGLNDIYNRLLVNKAQQTEDFS